MKQQKLDDFATLAAVYDRNAVKWRVMNALLSEDLTVQEMSQVLGVEQSRLSHQLAALKEHGVVKSRTEGKYRRFRLNNFISLVHLKEALAELTKGKSI